MKTGIIVLLFIFSFSVFSLETPSETGRVGMNKYERINKIEKDLIRLYKEVKILQMNMLTLKMEIKAELLLELKKD